MRPLRLLNITLTEKFVLRGWKSFHLLEFVLQTFLFLNVSDIFSGRFDILESSQCDFVHNPHMSGVSFGLRS